VTPHVSLRLKILVLAVVLPAALAGATLFTVDRGVRAHVDASSIHESLRRSVSVFESVLQTRSRELAGGARVIARDPRFFSLLMLGPSQHDSRFVATVREVSRDFNQITQSDLFEVLDRRGAVLATVGAAHSSREAREALVREALRGRPVEGVLAEPGVHLQVALTPVTADGRVVGALMLGREVGSSLARELRSQMSCEVTFVSDGTLTGTTLGAADDRAALLRELPRLASQADATAADAPVSRLRTPRGDFLTVVRRLPGADPATRQFYVMQRSFDPETTFQSAMRRDLLALAGIVMLVALVTGLLFSEQVLRPVQRLVRAAREMERGNYEHPLEVRSNDELGYLAARFAEMRRRERAYLGRLEHTEQVKSRFLSVAARELRSPVSVVSGYLDVLLSGGLGALTDAQRRALEAMRGDLARLTRLAEDAGRLARVTSERLTLELGTHVVEPLVRAAVRAACAAGSARAVAVEVECARIERPIEADAESLEQALFQLVTNAIRFTPDGGRVVVRANGHGDRLRLEVVDGGVGLASDRLAEVLAGRGPAAEALPRPEAAGLAFDAPGLGLGLPIATAIVEAHHGTLTATSQPGAGSTFVLELPMEQPGAERAAA
jgi:signal transduction histidine kinase